MSRDVALKAAENMEGKCEPSGTVGVSPYWCSWHDSRWNPGFAVCVRMAGYVNIAEQAIEDAEPVLREQIARDIERVAKQFDRDAMAVLVGARVARRTLP